ncbi:MAG TPA: hypothetical protein VIM16_16475 [Mucilaginibacter sp.]
MNTKSCFGYHKNKAFRRQNAFWVPQKQGFPKAKCILGTTKTGLSEGETRFGYHNEKYLNYCISAK